jgi:predicted nucleotidyltransferase
VLRDALRVAQEAGVSVAVAGGLAQQVWGRIRATRDIDLLVATSERATLLDAFDAAGFCRGPQTALGDADLVTVVREDTFIDIEVDLLLVSGGFGESAVTRAVPLDLDGLRVPFVTAEDLILLKLLADRVLDRADVRGIVLEQAGRLDLAYLRATAADLGLSDALEAALRAS